MYIYKRIIGLTGVLYTREFEKIKHHSNKIRSISESTVIKQFKAGKAEVHVYFEETDKSVHITSESDSETIKKYLGVNFL